MSKVPMFLNKRQAGIGFPYVEMDKAAAAPLIASGDGQDLRNTFVQDLKYPDYKGTAAPAPATDFSFGAPATAGAVAVVIGSPVVVPIVAIPGGSTLGTVTAVSATPANATVTVAGGNLTVTGVAAGSSVITVTMGSAHHDLTATVTAAGGLADEPSGASPVEGIVSLRSGAPEDGLAVAQSAEEAPAPTVAEKKQRVVRRRAE